jgi:hypothetical protein
LEHRGPNSSETYARRAPSSGVAGPGFDSRQLHFPTHHRRLRADHRGPLVQARVMRSPPARPPRASPAGTGDRPDATKGVGERVLSTPSSHDPVTHRRLCTTSPRRPASTGVSHARWGRPQPAAWGNRSARFTTSRRAHRGDMESTGPGNVRIHGAGVPATAPGRGWEAARRPGEGIDAVQARGCTDRHEREARAMTSPPVGRQGPCRRGQATVPAPPRAPGDGSCPRPHRTTRGARRSV